MKFKHSSSPEGEIEERHITKPRIPCAAAITLAAVCLAQSALADPTIFSVGVTPNPLRRGEPFAVTVAASPDVSQATLLVDFMGSKAVSGIQLSLTKQGTNWVGTSFVPNEVDVRDNKDEGKFRGLVFDPVARRDENRSILTSSSRRSPRPSRAASSPSPATPLTTPSSRAPTSTATSPSTTVLFRSPAAPRRSRTPR